MVSQSVVVVDKSLRAPAALAPTLTVSGGSGQLLRPVMTMLHLKLLNVVKSDVQIVPLDFTARSEVHVWFVNFKTIVAPASQETNLLMCGAESPEIITITPPELTVVFPFALAPAPIVTFPSTPRSGSTDELVIIKFAVGGTLTVVGAPAVDDPTTAPLTCKVVPGVTFIIKLSPPQTPRVEDTFPLIEAPATQIVPLPEEDVTATSPAPLTTRVDPASGCTLFKVTVGVAPVVGSACTLTVAVLPEVTVTAPIVTLESPETTIVLDPLT